MASPGSNGKTWDFLRCLETGRVTLWPRTHCVPHWVGEGKEGAAAGPAVAVMPSPLNTSVQLLRLARSYQHWVEGRPVAVAGEVAAGRYDVTVAYHGTEDEVLLLPPAWAQSGYFALRVRGSSMQEAGIQEGDYVVVRPQSSADSGDLVIAGLADSDDPEGYVTLKQIFWEGDHVRLQPANACMAPIHLYPQRGHDPVEIQGKVVAVVRMED